MLQEIKNPKLGVAMSFTNASADKVEKVLSDAVAEFSKRANVKGQFLNWVDLPKHQLERINEFYDLAAKLKSQTSAKFLTVLGIGGSKHTVEHMLSVNGLNIDNKVLFYSDIDSSSLKRYLIRIGNDVRNSNYLVASKSGSTFETKDGMLRIRRMLVEAYKAEGLSEEEANQKAIKHFIAVTDKNPATSELRTLSDKESWLGKLFIHDDVGGRFSSFDDHALFTLAYAGMDKADMEEVLKGAQEISRIALESGNLAENYPLAQAAFWSNGVLSGIKDSIHIYLGDMFRNTATMHAQMQNESVKNADKTILLGAECMHHTSEAMYNPANKFSFAFTAPADHGECRENVDGYTGGINKANSECGPSMLEKLETKELGLCPVTAGAMTQARAFATVYQEIIEKFVRGEELPAVLDSVLQPHVEFYKKNLKPIGGNKPPVEAGKVSE